MKPAKKQPRRANDRAEKIPLEATTADIATVLGLGSRRVHQIAQEAGIKPVSRNRYATADIVQSALEQARRQRAGAAERYARAALVAARARQIELQTARRELELAPVQETVAYVQMVIGAMVSRLNGLPAQFTRDLDERRRLEAAIDHIRREVSEMCADHAARYRATPDSPGGKLQ